jgi:hypothetical protein
LTLDRYHSLGALVCLLVALITSIYYWSPLLGAKWSIIDDHEIFTIIGPRQRLPLSEIPTALYAKTEIGQMGSASRFRPSYYTLRLLEASAWGKNPALWYSVRILIATMFAIVLALVVLSLADPILVVGFLLYVLSRPYWTDIFARLGPSETYAVLGVSISTLGLLWGLRTTFTSSTCAAVAIGTIIAAGSKENFVLLALVPLWLLVTRSSKISAVGKSWLIGAILYAIWVAVVVSYVVYNTGQDVYMNNISITNSLYLSLKFFHRVDVLIFVFGIVALFLCIRIQERAGALTSEASRILERLLAAAVIMLGVFMTQFVFYSGKIDDGRYLFPTDLARAGIIFVGAILITKLIVINTRHAFWGVAASFMMTLCILWKVSPEFDHNRFSVQQNVAMTEMFTRKIRSGTAFLKTHPDATLIINSHNVWDFEPIWSIVQYMRSSEVSNEIALNVSGYSAASLSNDPNHLLSILAAQLEDLEANGGWGELVSFEKISKAPCYSFGLSGPPAAFCGSGELIWP